VTWRSSAVLAALAAALILVLPLPGAAAAPPARPDLSRPVAAIVIDAADGTVMLQKNSRARRPIASTTKLMTALLTLEEARSSEVFTAPAYKAGAAESKINLRAGERMRVGDLLNALLLESANDAAATLATGVAGSRPAFVRQMNAKAAALGLRDTSYANPVGLDDPDNYSSARDLAALARRLLQDPRFASIVRKTGAVLESGARRRVIANRNDLVGRVPGVDGVKTGHTRTAGYVLVGSATGRLGARVVSVVLGDPSEAARDEDTVALLRWGLSRFRRVKPLDADRTVATTAIAHRDGRAALVPASDLLLTVRRGEKVTKTVKAPGELGGTPAGERVGTVTVRRGRQVVKRVALVTATEVPGAGPVRIVTHALGTGLTLLLLVFIVLGAGMVGIRASNKRHARARDERRRARARTGIEAEPGPEVDG
jgi:serine-type D-Ala-D-Ala carboxypeptidase (penicillin-binding protein 5/6)